MGGAAVRVRRLGTGRCEQILLDDDLLADNLFGGGIEKAYPDFGA